MTMCLQFGTAASAETSPAQSGTTPLTAVPTTQTTTRHDKPQTLEQKPQQFELLASHLPVSQRTVSPVRTPTTIDQPPLPILDLTAPPSREPLTAETLLLSETIPIRSSSETVLPQTVPPTHSVDIQQPRIPVDLAPSIEALPLPQGTLSTSHTPSTDIFADEPVELPSQPLPPVPAPAQLTPPEDLGAPSFGSPATAAAPGTRY